MNGFELDPAIDEVMGEAGRTLFESIVLAVAQGRMNKEQLRQWIEGVIRQSA